MGHGMVEGRHESDPLGDGAGPPPPTLKPVPGSSAAVWNGWGMHDRQGSSPGLALADVRGPQRQRLRQTSISLRRPLAS